MPVITFNEIVHKGKDMLKCRIRRSMSGLEILCVLSELILDIEKALDLSKVDIVDLGLDACDKTGQNLITRILNKLIETDQNLADQISTINTTVQNIGTSINSFSDEKVKTSSADTQAGYLVDKIVSPQAGTITHDALTHTIKLMGFAPIGAVMMIDSSRAGDFDATGKGKANTDVWGWAISNGQNGTRNRFGKFPRFIGVLADAGNSGGADTFTVKKENVGSFDLAVTGSISDALPDDISPRMYFNTNKIADGSGGSTPLLRLGDGLTGSNSMAAGKFNVKHSHNFTLSAKHTNPNPTAISLLPAFLYEIPIQRIL